MNSLVVFLSVMALAAAKPSVPLAGVISYSAPGLAIAPAAVSHQSRVDIKSSPAVVATEVVAPVARTVISQPAVIAQPAIAQPAIAAPIAYSTPLAYSAPIARIGASAVSTQSRVDIKSSPAVVSTYSAPLYSSIAAAPIAAAPLAARTVISQPAVFAQPALAARAVISQPAVIAQPALAARAVISQPAVIAQPALAAPVAYSSPLAYSSILSPSLSPVSIADTRSVKTEILSEAPAQVEAELPVAPEETPEVAAARAAHLEAKAEIEHAHQIQKRSVLLSSPVITSYSAVPRIATPIHGAYIPTARLALPAPVPLHYY